MKTKRVPGKENWFEFMDRAKENGVSPATQERLDKLCPICGNGIEEAASQHAEPIGGRVKNIEFLMCRECSDKKEKIWQKIMNT